MKSSHSSPAYPSNPSRRDSIGRTLKKQFRVGRWIIQLLGACLPLVAHAEQAPSAFCRLVPERMDDFAWENDRVAFRVYGPKLWQDPAKRCGSGIDVWVKKVRYPIIDKWMKNKRKGGKYHIDTGEGADLYKVGKTLGCGGLGFWANDKLHINRHFTTHKVMQGKGKRIEFELTYAPLKVDGKTITETKRISMETGSNLFKVENSFAITGGDSVMAAVGIVRQKGKDDIQHGLNWLGYALPASPTDGQTYCGVVLANPAKFKKTNDHVLMLTPVKNGETLTYYAGAGWSKGLDFKNTADWMDYLRGQAKKVNSSSTSTPIPVLSRSPAHCRRLPRTRAPALDRCGTARKS
jgi:unsaturated rhamnogalacturonyl hydrolase